MVINAFNPDSKIWTNNVRCACALYTFTLPYVNKIVVPGSTKYRSIIFHKVKAVKNTDPKSNTKYLRFSSIASINMNTHTQRKYINPKKGV